MKSLVALKYGGFEHLRVADTEKPSPAEGEVLIKTRAAGVNPVDWKLLSGYRDKNLPAVFPYIVGWDVSGTVEDRGHGARRFNTGEKVYGYIRRPVLRHGSYAEYVAVPECYIVKAPDKISLKDAAAVPLAALTAYQGMLSIGHLTRNENILILGASGGVGTFAVQIAKIIGTRVTAVASAENQQYLRNIGADHVLDYNQPDWVNQARENQPDIIFDCIGGETMNLGIPALKNGGRVVSTTANTYSDPSVNFSGMFVEPNSRNLELITSWIEQGKLKPYVSRYFKLDDAVEALRISHEGKTRSKMVITIGES